MPWGVAPSMLISMHAPENPAKALHALLSQVAESIRQHPSKPLRDHWKIVLGGDEGLQGPLALHLAAAVRLFDDTERLLSLADDDAFLVDFRAEAPALMKLIIPFQSSGVIAEPNNRSTLVDRNALRGLRTAGSFLDAWQVSTRLANPGALPTLEAQISELRANVMADDSIPQDLRFAIVSRLHDISWAIARIEIYGADGLKAAMERLAGVLVLNRDRGEWLKQYAGPIIGALRLMVTIIFGVTDMHGLDQTVLLGLPPGEEDQDPAGGE